jgi:hypothetical protein
VNDCVRNITTTSTQNKTYYVLQDCSPYSCSSYNNINTNRPKNQTISSIYIQTSSCIQRSVQVLILSEHNHSLESTTSRCCNVGQVRVCSISVMLLVVWYRLQAYLAARRWTISILLQCSAVWGSQTEHEWTQHTNNIVANANKSLGFFKRNLKTSKKIIKSQAYLSLVRPKLEYVCSVWDPHTVEHCNKIEMVQRRAARYACNRYHNIYIYIY